VYLICISYVAAMTEMTAALRCQVFWYYSELLGEWLVSDILEEHIALIFKDYLALIILYTIESQFKFLSLRYSCILCSFCGPGQNPM